MKKNAWDEMLEEVEEEEEKNRAAMAWTELCALLREQGLVVVQAYEWWQWSWGKAAGKDYASYKEAVLAAIRWKTGRPKIRRETVFALVLLLLCLIGMMWVWGSVAKETCALDAGACRGMAPQASGICFQQRAEVTTQEITTGTTTVGEVTLFYSPICKSAFAHVVLTHPGAVADLSVQLLIEHPGSYTDIADSGILSRRHEVWSTFVPVPSGTMISASATMATSRTTMVIQTSKTFLASW